MKCVIQRDDILPTAQTQKSVRQLTYIGVTKNTKLDESEPRKKIIRDEGTERSDECRYHRNSSKGKGNSLFKRNQRIHLNAILTILQNHHTSLLSHLSINYAPTTRQPTSGYISEEQCRPARMGHGGRFDLRRGWRTGLEFQCIDTGMVGRVLKLGRSF